LILKGLIIVQPNTARVLNLFGKYVGSVKDNGIFFVNPFYTANKLTQRVQNLAIPTLKVNDKMGNPVEIAGVIVWQIQDTYKAAYDVADYNAFVRMQSEAALRTLTMGFAYDNIEDEHAVLTLREGGAKINELLETELNERLVTAGIPHKPPCLCPGNSRGHAAAPTGKRYCGRKVQNSGRCGEHGGTGARPTEQKRHYSPG
jgi:regulator of protease activity HflC (stomatin/prohibitin superfamily)